MHFISFGRMGLRLGGLGVVAEVGEDISFVIVLDDDDDVAVAVGSDEVAGGGGLGNGCLLII